MSTPTNQTAAGQCVVRPLSCDLCGSHFTDSPNDSHKQMQRCFAITSIRVFVVLLFCCFFPRWQRGLSAQESRGVVTPTAPLRTSSSLPHKRWKPRLLTANLMEADNTDAASAWTLRRPRKGNMAAACHNTRKKKKPCVSSSSSCSSPLPTLLHLPPTLPSPGCQPPVRDEIRLHMDPRASSAAYTKTTTSLCEWRRRRRHFHVSVSGAGGGG